MQAFADGKRVEMKLKESTTWEEIALPAWDWVAFDYRVKQGAPRTWEEFCEQYKDATLEYYISNFSLVSQTSGTSDRSVSMDVNLLKTKEDAEGLLSLIKLKRIRDAWWRDWKPNSAKCKFAIIKTIDPNDGCGLSIGTTFNNRLLMFETKAIADDFLLCFEDLIKKAEMWL